MTCTVRGATRSSSSRRRRSWWSAGRRSGRGSSDWRPGQPTRLPGQLAQKTPNCATIVTVSRHFCRRFLPEARPPGPGRTPNGHLSERTVTRLGSKFSRDCRLPPPAGESDTPGRATGIWHTYCWNISHSGTSFLGGTCGPRQDRRFSAQDRRVEQSVTRRRQETRGIRHRPHFWANSPLDSLGLVGLLIDVEEAFAAEGHPIVLSDEKALSQRRSPYRDVPSLVDYIESCSPSSRREQADIGDGHDARAGASPGAALSGEGGRRYRVLRE